MDQSKTGRFMAALRKERGLTQEALGERLGVTNRTVSRWETGRYMPDIDKLQELAALLGVSVNELLSGERLAGPEQLTARRTGEKPAVPAGDSPFGLPERTAFFRRKWRREHRGYIALCLLLWSAAFLAAARMKEPLLWASLPLLGLCLFCHVRSRMLAYVERRAFVPRGPETS